MIPARNDLSREATESAMMTAEENDLLCRVEGEAPMGQLMRRHWMPACMSEEVADRDGAPLRVRLLGEDLVVFRDSEGRLGVLDEYCPHRNASLAFGRNEQCGLRCLYHGWKFDVDGNVVEMSSEPADSGFPRKVMHKAYPAHEAAGFVWTYMGPEAETPAFELPAFAPAPDVRVSILKIKVKANWAQITEGQIDSAHSSSLHSSDMVPARVDSARATDANWLRPSTDKAPRLEVQRTSFGFRYAAIRRPIVDAATHQYVRTTVYVAPFTSLIPPNDIHNVATVLVPMDDASTYFYFIAWNGPDKPGIDQETWRKFNHAQPGIDLDTDFTNRRTRENNYLQDRNAMKLGNFTGIPGIPNQDIAMWETMGRTGISDRTRERLGSSDVAVIQFRRIMIDAARQVASGGPALGRTEPHVPHTKISSFEGVVLKTADWRTLGVAAEELAAGGEAQVA